MPKSDSDNDPKFIARRVEALALRMKGENYLDIGKLMGTSQGTAFKDVKAAEQDETIMAVIALHKQNCLETALNSVVQMARFTKQISEKDEVKHEDVRELEKMAKTTIKVYSDLQGSKTDDKGGEKDLISLLDALIKRTRDSADEDAGESILAT